MPTDSHPQIYKGAIEDFDELLVPSIILTEVFKSILRQKTEESALEVVAHMQQGRVVPLDSTLAIAAATIGVELKLPLADSIIYATARRFNATVWTQDSDFEGLEGVEYYAKPSAAT